MTTATNTNTEADLKQMMDAAAAKTGATAPDPLPAYNGRLVQIPGKPEVYFVINGYRRWIPNYPSFLNLFLREATIERGEGIKLISEGPALSDGAALAKSAGDDRIYLVTNWIKMWIPSPAMFKYCQFDASKVVNSGPRIILDSVLTGPDIQPPPQD